ncbi:MAG: HEAT repeat domain-containing protein [Terriglobia bacterium]
MTVSIATICDPSAGDLAEAIRQAKTYALAGAGFDVYLSRFLQGQCHPSRVQLPVIFRGLEVLEAITEQSKLLTLLRPFLRSSDPQIASKCVVVLGRRCQSLGWVKSVMAEVDDRIRANLVESLWRRPEPEVELIMRSALRDSNPRVAANATYGLYLLGSTEYSAALDELTTSEEPGRRRCAIWVIRSIGASEAAARIKTLIRDPDPAVRHAAFQAMVYIREHPAKPQPAAGVAAAAAAA